MAATSWPAILNSEITPKKHKNVKTWHWTHSFTLWERKQEHKVESCLTSVGNVPVWQLRFFPTPHRSTDDCGNAPNIGLKLQINFSEWANSQIHNSRIRRLNLRSATTQCLLRHCCVTFSELFTLSVGFFSIYWISFCSGSKTNKAPSPPWGFPNNSSWGWIVSFFPESPPFTDTHHSSVTVSQMMAPFLEQGQLYPPHTVLLGYSSLPSSVAMAATSWPSWSMTAVRLCARPCLCLYHGAKGLFGLGGWGWCRSHVISALWINCFFLLNIPHHLAYSAIIMLM